jgi:uncharacterized protein YeaO (DUF488 family)
MQTSNFALAQRGYFLGGISVSRYPSQFFTGPEFSPLMPSRQLLSAFKHNEIDWTEYRIAYQFQLGLLNPTGVWNALHEIAGPHEPVLLCVEGAKTLEEKPCHRRLVADWLGRALGEEIPEWSKPNV